MVLKYKWLDADSNQMQQDILEELELIQTYEAGYRQMIPEEIGEGYFQYALSGASSPIVSTCDFRFHKSLCMEEQMKEDGICMLSFCLSDGFEWSLIEAGGNTFSIGEKESCIMMGGTEKCVSLYNAGHSYRGIGVGFRAEQLSGVMECLNCSGAITRMPGSQMILKRYMVTPHVEVILQQIMGCKICGSLRDVYLEGKLLELIAVYLDEMVCQRGKDTGYVPLFAEDLSSLQQAKEILDRHYVHPLTLSQLSKRVCLNEFKLKVGFKERYGQTVYGYILDKRMELARLLLEQGKFKVKDIAGMVGYANISHFIEAFQKKFGTTPGAYLRNTN